MKVDRFRQTWCHLLVLAALLLASPWLRAQDGFVQLPLERGEAKLPVYVMRHAQAIATVVLLPGGDAGTGKIVDDQPGSSNFLVRARQHFQQAGFNVLVVFRASDLSGLDYGYRISPEHVAELSKAVAYAQREFGKPVWLIGTSRGTVSGTATAIALGEKSIAGLVLTSSVTSRRTGAIESQNVASLRMPTLVLHHKYDSCKICVPAEAARIVDQLKSAPVRKFIMVDGGSNPEGDPCESRHWHGYINFEQQTVQLITDWIKSPKS